MITILSAIGGAAAAKIAHGKERRKEKDVQLLAEVQGTKQALSQERAKRLRAERNVSKLQSDAAVADKQLAELQQEKALLLQQLQVLQQQAQGEPHVTAAADSTGSGSPTAVQSTLNKKMRFLKTKFTNMQKRFQAVSEENEGLKQGMAAVEQQKAQLQEEKSQLESKASQLMQATERLSRRQQDLEEKLKAMIVEHDRALEQAALTKKLESRLQLMEEEVSNVFTALLSKQLTEEQAVDKLQALGCVVRLVEPAAADRQQSCKLLVETAAVPEDLSSDTNGQTDPFQMSFVLEAPDKLRRLMSNRMSRTSSCSSPSPTDRAYRPPSMFSSRALANVDTKVFDHHTSALPSPRPADSASVKEPAAQQLQGAHSMGGAASEKAGLSTYFADKTQQSMLQHHKSDQQNGWSLKTASLHLPKFLTSSRSLERGQSGLLDHHAQHLTMAAAASDAQDMAHSSARDIVVSPVQQSV